MSAEATVWAWEEQKEIPPNEGILLLALADNATDDGLYIGGHEMLQEKMGVSYTTVSRLLGKLEERKLFVRRPQYSESGGREKDAIRLAMKPCDEGGLHRGSTRTRQEFGTEERKEDPPRGTRRRLSLPDIPLGIEIPDEIQKDAEQFLWAKRKVGGKVITPEEMLVAAAALAEFNRQAETHQGLASVLTSIIGRVRDRPSWDAEKHVRLVQSAFRIRWWERNGRRGGRLTPAVIYGNERCFENVALDAVDEAAGKGKKIEQRRGRFQRTRSVEED